jgi:hypothetical protein
MTHASGIDLRSLALRDPLIATLPPPHRSEFLVKLLSSLIRGIQNTVFC